MVGSEELKISLSKYNNDAFINTSPIVDLNVVKKKKNNILNIGWIGYFGGGHRESLLQFFFPALKELDFDIKLTILGVYNNDGRDFIIEYFNANKNINIEIPMNIDWLNEKEIQNRISKFDLGIATLLDNEFHRSKSGFKLKQYMNNGIPVLSSLIKENSVFLNDSKNGYFCNSKEDFKNRISEFNQMNDYDYKSFIESSRKSIVNFNLENYAKTLFQNIN